jgi:hypothetical protein
MKKIKLNIYVKDLFILLMIYKYILDNKQQYNMEQ